MSASEKQDKISNKILDREKNRIASLQEKTLSEKGNKAEHETETVFNNKFNQLYQKIVDDLALSKNLDLTATNVVNEHFDKIFVLLQELQKYTTDSSIFLPAFYISKATHRINEINEEILTRKKDLLPKKKFTFKAARQQNQTQEKTNKPFEVNKTVECSEKTINDPDKVCGFVHLTNKTVSKDPLSINNKDVTLSHLTNCNVELFGFPSAVHINNLTGCCVYIGPVTGSVFLETCLNCSFYIAAQQMRIHQTSECSFYIHVTSKAIIEDSKGLGFAPYSWSYPELEEHYEKSGLKKEVNNWNKIDDFNWLVANTQSPNWFIIDVDKRKT